MQGRFHSAWPNPAANPIRTASARLRAPSRVISDARCTSTVRWLIPSSRAISLLERPATSDVSTDCFTRRQRRQFRRAWRAGGDRLGHRFQQAIRRIRLLDEVRHTQAHRRHGERHVAMAGDDDHRERRRGTRGQRALHIEPGHHPVPHPYIDHGAGWRFSGVQLRHHRLARSEGGRAVAGAIQQHGQRAPYAIVVVHHVNQQRAWLNQQGIGAHHCQAASWLASTTASVGGRGGRVNMNAAPPFAWLAAVIQPPCADTIVRQIASPTPEPAFLGTAAEHVEQPLRRPRVDTGATIHHADHGRAALRGA